MFRCPRPALAPEGRAERRADRGGKLLQRGPSPLTAFPNFLPGLGRGVLGVAVKVNKSEGLHSHSLQGGAKQTVLWPSVMASFHQLPLKLPRSLLGQASCFQEGKTPPSPTLVLRT